MNCQVFEKVVIPLAHNRLMDAVIREQSLLHSEVCTACALRLNQEHMLMAGVRAVAAEIALQEAPAHLEIALLNAFREQKVAAVAPVDMPILRKKHVWSNWQLKALAAGILLLISAVATLWLQQGWANRQLGKQASLAAPACIPVPEAILLASGGVVVEQQVTYQEASSRPPKRLRHQVSRNPLPETETVTEFFPLSENNNLDSLESGQIVRVELSGSALLAAGLPVDAATVNEPVKADVILGHDGQALAIRFVR
jgi:hypothetical protein